MQSTFVFALRVYSERAQMMCDSMANDTTRSASQNWTYSKPNTTSRNRLKPHGWRTGKYWKNEINCWRFLIATKRKSNNNYYCNKRSKNGKIEKLIEWEFHFLTCDGKTIWWTDTTGIIFTKLSTWGGFIRFLLNVGARASLMKSEI